METIESKRLKGRQRMQKWRSLNPEKAKQAGRKSAEVFRKKFPELHRNRVKAWRKVNKVYMKTFNRKRGFTKYGITREDYDELLIKQGNACAICRRGDPAMGKEFFCIDHDHSCCSGNKSCGKCVRGLLCIPCNLGIGNLQDSISIIKLAAEYLERYQ